MRSLRGRFGRTSNRHWFPNWIQCLEHDFSFHMGWVWGGKSQTTTTTKSSTAAWSWQRMEREQRETKALVGSVPPTQLLCSCSCSSGTNLELNGNPN